MKVTVVGCGDAFGSGGRLQTSFLLETGAQTALLDCGASTLIGLNRLGVDPGKIETVFVSHLHGDHFSGLVWLLIQGQHPGRRTAPLTLVGPEGLEERLHQASEVLFPGSMARDLRFPVSYETFAAGDTKTVGDVKLTAFEGMHPSGALSAALRLEAAGKTLAFSGDTEWVDDLIPCADGADALICECYATAPGIRYHLDWETLVANADHLTASHIYLCHMNPDMLAARATLSHPRFSFLSDGQIINL
ncbi:MAG: MBL fold metallo-hydrolase [Pseudomonadota bacterium]